MDTRTGRRRRNKTLRKVADWKSEGEEELRDKTAQLLEKWRAELDFRARRWKDNRGREIPGVWDFVRRKREIAMALDIEDDLAELAQRVLRKHYLR